MLVGIAMASQGAVTLPYLLAQTILDIETIADGIAYVESERARAIEQRLSDVTPRRGRR